MHKFPYITAIFYLLPLLKGIQCADTLHDNPSNSDPKMTSCHLYAGEGLYVHLGINIATNNVTRSITKVILGPNLTADWTGNCGSILVDSGNWVMCERGEISNSPLDYYYELQYHNISQDSSVIKFLNLMYPISAKTYVIEVYVGDGSKESIVWGGGACSPFTTPATTQFTSLTLNLDGDVSSASYEQTNITISFVLAEAIIADASNVAYYYFGFPPLSLDDYADEYLVPTGPLVFTCNHSSDLLEYRTKQGHEAGIATTFTFSMVRNPEKESFVQIRAMSSLDSFAMYHGGAVSWYPTAKPMKGASVTLSNYRRNFPSTYKFTLDFTPYIPRIGYYLKFKFDPVYDVSNNYINNSKFSIKITQPGQVKLEYVKNDVFPGTIDIENIINPDNCGSNAAINVTLLYKKMTNSGTESPTYVLVSMQEALNYASMEPTTIESFQNSSSVKIVDYLEIKKTGAYEFKLKPYTNLPITTMFNIQIPDKLSLDDTCETQESSNCEVDFFYYTDPGSPL